MSFKHLKGRFVFNDKHRYAINSGYNFTILQNENLEESMKKFQQENYLTVYIVKEPLEMSQVPQRLTEEEFGDSLEIAYTCSFIYYHYIDINRLNRQSVFKNK